MLKMGVYTAQGIQSSSLSTWNERSTHNKRETNVRIVPPINIPKDTGRGQAAAAAAHTGRLWSLSRGGGPNYTTHFCLAWTIKAEVRGQ